MAGVALLGSMGSPGAAAARCATRLAGRIVPNFRGRFEWSGEGLVVSSSGSATAVVPDPGEWSLQPSHGLAEAMPSLIAPVAALGVLATAVLDALPPALGGRLVGSIDGLVARVPDSAPGEWLGFLQVRNGWIGVVTVGEQATDLLDFALGAGSLRSRNPVAAATYLQTLGIAALPARTAPARRRPVMPEQDSPLPVLSWEGREGGPGILLGQQIVDLGRVVAGPFAGRLLESLGATVHRLRPPGEGQRWGVDGEEVDLRRPGGIARLREVLGPADLVVENYRPRAWDQLIEPIGGDLVRHRLALRGFPGSSRCLNWKVYGFLVEAAFGVGPCPAQGSRGPFSAGRVPLWDRVTGVVGVAAAVATLGTGATLTEVSQIALARELVRVRGEWARGA